MSPGSLLVIGVGNPARGDDGIGGAVIDAIRAAPELAGVETMVAGGDLSDLVVSWASHPDVVIVDAMVGGGPPGTIREIDALRDPLPEPDRPLSSHGYGLVDTLELARVLGRLPRSLTIVTVEAGAADTLSPLSDPARKSVDEVLATITALAAGGDRGADVEKGEQVP